MADTEDTKAAPRLKRSQRGKNAPAASRTSPAKADEGRKPKGRFELAATGGTVTVVQTGSSTRRPADQHATLVGLGLGRIGKRRSLVDTASVRGMIAKVAHMVRVEDAPAAGEK